MKSCHWLSLVAQAGWGLCHSASEISLLSSTAVSVQWPHRALACRLFPFHPPRALMTSAPPAREAGGGKAEKWRGDGYREEWELEYRRKGKRLGVWLLKEMTKANVSGLVSGWLGFVSRLVQLFFFFCTHISRKMRPILPHSPAACVKQVSWLA